MAKTLLSRNTGNRCLRPRRVAQIADAIARGEWRVNGDTIRFCRDGRLLDGQHRLTAVSEGKAAVEMVFVFGLEADAQDTMGIGAARSQGDQLGIHGVRYPRESAATATLIHRYTVGTRSSNTQPSMAQTRAILEAYPVEKICAEVSAISGADGLLPVSLLAMVGCLTRQGHAKLMSFSECARTGVGLESRYDPVLLLRREMACSKEARQKLPREVKAAYVVKAWNAWQAGSERTYLRWRSNESFPVIK